MLYEVITESYMATALDGLRQLGAEEEQRQTLRPSTVAVAGDRQDRRAIEVGAGGDRGLSDRNRLLRQLV